MTSFIKFRQQKPQSSFVQLVETTVPPHLQYKAESWDHHSKVSDETKEKMHSAMNGKQFTTFPLAASSDSDMDADVADHLTKHGYSVKDYGRGIASIKKQVGDPSKGIPLREKVVEEKIGSVLDKTGATPEVKKLYMNDPARAASKNASLKSTGHHVCITHSPMGIAGMSTGTSWADNSCMDMGRSTGYNHKLEDDSNLGTHVAYLIPHDDKTGMEHGEPSKPIARIALKPYHESHGDPTSDTIYRPETKMYGSGNTSFDKAVSDWALKNYPAKAGVTYKKNPNVYDDTGNTEYKSLTKKQVSDKIESFDPIVNQQGTSLDKEVIDHAINHLKNDDSNSSYTHTNTIRNIADIGNLSTQHVSALLHHTKTSKFLEDQIPHLTNILAQRHGDKFSTQAIEDYTKDNSPTNKMLMNPKLPDHIIDSIPTSDYQYVRRSKLKPKHYDKVVDNYVEGKSGSSYYLRDHAGYYSKENIDKLSNIPRGEKLPVGVIMNSEHFSKEHHDNMVNTLSKSPNKNNIDRVLSESKYATLKDADKLGSGVDKLSHNPHISDSDAEEIKNRFVSAASLGTHATQGGKYYVNGFVDALPTKISSKLTPDDYSTLAKSGKSLKFESPFHSNKHLDAIRKNMEKADDDISDHIENKESHDEDYDKDEDEHVQHLKSKLETHVENYARNIDAHIDKHVAEGQSNEETTKNHAEAEKTHDRLGHIDKLTHYNTDANSGAYSDKDHYYDHVADVHERLKNMYANDEARDNGEW